LWSKAEMPRKVEYRLTKQNSDFRIGEAALEYVIGGPDGEAVTTISSKNQITLPAQMLREMGLGAGDRLAITREDGRLILRARPKDWVQYHGGSLRGLYGKDEREIEAYIEGLREDSSRDEEIERAWAGTESTPER
jgi:AbrB family looped-hinge helix DNA binding protein